MRCIRVAVPPRRRRRSRRREGSLLGVGLLALALAVCAELGLAVFLQSQTLAEYFGVQRKWPRLTWSIIATGLIVNVPPIFSATPSMVTPKPAIGNGQNQDEIQSTLCDQSVQAARPHEVAGADRAACAARADSASCPRERVMRTSLHVCENPKDETYPDRRRAGTRILHCTGSEHQSCA